MSDDQEEVISIFDPMGNWVENRVVKKADIDNHIIDEQPPTDKTETLMSEAEE